MKAGNQQPGVAALILGLNNTYEVHLHWAVELQPGNYMAFFEPWESGDYDT